MTAGSNSSTGTNRRTVLITGASTGIGRACATRLASQGFDVFAGVRKTADAEAVERSVTGAGGGSIRGVLIDVTDAASITRAIEHVAAAVGDDGLLGLVNNAGVTVVGPVEFVSLDDWRRQFEINFFGHIAVTQAALPLLRAHVAKRGPGSARIVNMSSIAGRIGQPILGPYTASKFALESLSDSLRLELRPQGIQVCVVQPGAIDTPIWNKGQESSRGAAGAPPARALYGKQIDAIEAAAKKAAASAIPADAVAKVVEACLTKPRPRTRYLVGRDAKAGAAARALLPDRWFDAALARAVGLYR